MRKLVLLFSGLVFSGFALAQGTLIWSIVGATGAVLAALSGGYFICQDVMRRRLLKNPLIVVHFIPQAQYRLATFPGALPNEQYPKELIVGVGHYRIMQRVTPKTEVSIGPIVLRFEGPDENKPLVAGRDNPFIIDQLPGFQFRDWHGDVHPGIEGWPRQFHRSIHVMFGNRIETTGNWQGLLSIEFPVYGSKAVYYRLPFRVSESIDMISFLKGWEDGTSAKGETNSRMSSRN